MSWKELETRLLDEMEARLERIEEAGIAHNRAK